MPILFKALIVWTSVALAGRYPYDLLFKLLICHFPSSQINPASPAAFTLLPEATSTTESSQLEVTKLPEVVELKEEDGKMVPNGLPTVYVVQKGDSTWGVAKAFYESGYNYVDIEKENNLKHNQYLEVGMKLTVPKVEVIAPKEVVKTQVSLSENKNIPETYTVQKGDYLWKIAVQIYGNGFDWEVIYNANKDVITQPNSIETGMTLVLPRKQFVYLQRRRI